MGSIEGLSTRSMDQNDLIFAVECTQNEGWVSQDYASLEGLYLHDRDGCLVSEIGDKPVGMCIATPYGRSGFIGELIVRPEVRGQGIGSVLLAEAVGYLLGRGALTVYLDGAVKAVPLYERSGFRRICRSLRFGGTLAGRSDSRVRPMRPDDLPAVLALDRQAFGARRGFFLERGLKLFPHLSKVMERNGELTGFIQGRSGAGWITAGPWVMADGEQGALALLESLALEGDSSCMIKLAVLDINQPAVNLLRRLGFHEREDSLWRMAFGPDSDLGTSARCWGAGSSAKG